MSRFAPSDERALLPLPPRAHIVPIVSTMAGSLLATMPIIADAPVLPPFGLLMFLAWRLLRPELWPAWMALPLGLFDDLMSGQPLGSSMALWTAVFLTLDMVDNRTLWRDYWLEWLVAAAMIAFCLIGGWAFVAFTSGAGASGGGSIRTIVPQMLITILSFPAALRLCAALDRWRLAR